MIGQIKLYNTICRLDNLPKCSLLIGDRGCEQLGLINNIGKYFDLHTIVVDDISTESVRNIIDMAYKVQSPTLYVFYKADNMHSNAKNSLLKVTEEPPNNSYFIITLQDENNTLNTIQSRATTFHCDRYTPDQLLEYYKKHNKYNEVFENDIVAICDNIGDIDLLCEYNIQEFNDYVGTVIDNIGVVSGANCFKIANMINLKNEPNKYDLRLFWRVFANKCNKRALGDVIYNNFVMYCEGMRITLNALRELKNPSINKQMLFDKWILDIRKEWL